MPNKLTAVFFTLMILPYVAFAKVDTRVKWDGSYRLRAYTASNLSVDSGENTDVYSHRLILSGEMAPNDDIKTYFSINMNEIIGSDGRRGELGIQEPDSSDDHNLQIFEAYADWHLGSSFFLRFGRMGLSWGNETLVSRNLDDQRPYSFDGVVLGYESEALLLSLGVLRVGDWSRAQGPESTIDPDESAYYATLALRSFGQALEKFEFFLLRIQSSDFTDADTGVSISGSSLNRLGFSLGGSRRRFFYNLDYVNLLGSYNTGSSAQAWMGHLNIGLNLGNVNPFQLYAIGHYDSGDDSASLDQDEGYKPVYYNHHRYGGVMDLLSWGNLTYYGLGSKWVYKEKTEFKLQALRFALSDNSGGPQSISYLGFDSADSFISEDVATNANGESASALGTEIDLTFTRNFPSNAYIEIIAGLFLPDDYFKSYGREDEIFSVRLTTGFSF